VYFIHYTTVSIDVYIATKKKFRLHCYRKKKVRILTFLLYLASFQVLQITFHNSWYNCFTNGCTFHKFNFESHDYYILLCSVQMACKTLNPLCSIKVMDNTTNKTNTASHWKRRNLYNTMVLVKHSIFINDRTLLGSILLFSHQYHTKY
jgi:hypothetical protein